VEKRAAQAARIGAAGRAEPEVVVVQAAPRAAAGNRAAIAVALDHRVGTAPARVAQTPGELLRRLGVDLGRTHLLLIRPDRILRPLRMELAALPGPVVAGPQQQRARKEVVLSRNVKLGNGAPVGHLVAM
jgi:hypothetical protein